MEGQIGWYRRNHFVPVPDVASLAELNALVEQWDAADDARRIGTRPLTVGEAFEQEGGLCQPRMAGRRRSQTRGCARRSWTG